MAHWCCTLGFVATLCCSYCWGCLHLGVKKQIQIMLLISYSYWFHTIESNDISFSYGTKTHGGCSPTSNRGTSWRVCNRSAPFIQRCFALCIQISRKGMKEYKERSTAQDNHPSIALSTDSKKKKKTKKENYWKTVQEENWEKPTDPMLGCMWIPWGGGKRKEGKDFLSFCLHTSPSACINSLPSEE